MLNLTMKKTADVAKCVAVHSPMLEDVMLDIDRRAAASEITSTTADSYRAAIRLLARKHNVPVKSCRADLADFERRFPLDGFDPDWHNSEDAYLTWRRRAQGSLGAALGVAEKRRKQRHVCDDWTHLVEALKPYTKNHPTRWVVAPQKLIAIEQFAQTCRQYERQPQSIDCAFMLELETHYGGNKRWNHRRAAIRMDEWRAIPEVADLLPPRPIGFDKADWKKPIDVPTQFMAEIEPWVLATTQADWDPVDKEFTSDHREHARVARCAFRTYLRSAVSNAAIDAIAPSCLPAFLDHEAARAVLSDLIARTKRPKGMDRLSPRTIRKYLKVIVQVLGAADHEPEILVQALNANRVLSAGAKAEKRMTPENQKFCERLVERKDHRVKFLGSFLWLRRAAEEILDAAKAEARGLTPRERSRVCLLGMCAAFAALEIAGAPLRIVNVLNAHMFGDDAWIRVPDKGNGPIKVHIPAEFTKAGVEAIRFQIKPNKYQGHDTILWFVRRIRPLIPAADGNCFFLPSPRKPGAPVSDKWFREEFKAAMRSIVGLPACPHQFRHGQASLLLNKHPGEVVVIAKRTGHSVGTLLRFYAFLDAIKAMERGQDMMLGLMDD